MTRAGDAQVAATRAYVTGVRRLRAALERRGTLAAWDARARPGSWSAHARSQLAVYDAAELARLGSPWWSYAATAEVDRFLREDCGGHAQVFEYGSGASTVWLAARAAHVTSVEHDTGFAPVVRDLLAEHGLTDAVDLHVVPAPASAAPVLPSAAPSARGRDFAAYAGTLDRVGGDYDLVVVDGRVRVACVAVALRHLRPGGVVLLDDAHRRRYRPALEAAERAGVRVVRHRGAAPTVPLPRTTALLRPGG